MQRRVVVVSAAAAVLGLAAAVLGFAAEYFKNKALVGPHGFRCEYRRTPALGCGILAALLSLTGVALVTAASRGFGCNHVAGPAAWTWCGYDVKPLVILAWLLVVATAVMFLYGASRNAGGTGGFSAVSRDGRDGRKFDFVCAELKRGVFTTASFASAVGIACAIAAYIDLQKRDETATLGVAMGQPYPPPPAYPAQPPYGGYGAAKQPAGTA